MPETPVHKYADPLVAKNEVRIAKQFLFSSPAGEFVSTKDPNQPQLRRLVAARADARHDRTLRAVLRTVCLTSFGCPVHLSKLISTQGFAPGRPLWKSGMLELLNITGA